MQAPHALCSKNEHAIQARWIKYFLLQICIWVVGRKSTPYPSSHVQTTRPCPSTHNTHFSNLQWLIFFFKLLLAQETFNNSHLCRPNSFLCLKWKNCNCFKQAPDIWKDRHQVNNGYLGVWALKIEGFQFPTYIIF